MSDSVASMRRIWEDILLRPVEGDEADFFALGGTSLQAVDLIARVNAQYGTALDIMALLDAPTLSGFALRVGAAP